MNQLAASKDMSERYEAIGRGDDNRFMMMCLFVLRCFDSSINMNIIMFLSLSLSPPQKYLNQA